MSSLCFAFFKVKTLLENMASIFKTSAVWHFWSDSDIASTNILKVLYGRLWSISKSFWLRDDCSGKLQISSLSSTVRMHLEIKLSNTSLSSIAKGTSLSFNSLKAPVKRRGKYIFTEIARLFYNLFINMFIALLMHTLILDCCFKKIILFVMSCSSSRCVIH